MATLRRIGILTAGGDCPGLNAVIRAVAKAAMGGGMMESAFGPDTSNVLSRLTIRGAIVFFLLSFLIFLGYIRLRSHPAGAREALPNIPAPAASASAPAPAPASAQPAAPAVSIPITAAPDAAKTTTQSSPPPKSP